MSSNTDETDLPPSEVNNSVPPIFEDPDAKINWIWSENPSTHQNDPQMKEDPDYEDGGFKEKGQNEEDANVEEGSEADVNEKVYGDPDGETPPLDSKEVFPPEGLSIYASGTEAVEQESYFVLYTEPAQQSNSNQEGGSQETNAFTAYPEDAWERSTRLVKYTSVVAAAVGLIFVFIILIALSIRGEWRDLGFKLAFGVVCHGKQLGHCVSFQALKSASVQKDICEKHSRKVCLEKQKSVWKASRDVLWQHNVDVEALGLPGTTPEGSQTNEEFPLQNLEALSPEYWECELRRDGDYAHYCKYAEEQTEPIQKLEGMLLGLTSALFVLQLFAFCTTRGEWPLRWFQCSLVLAFWYFLLTCYAISSIAMEPEPDAGNWVPEAVRWGLIWLFAGGAICLA